jgi:phosphinothricin acetyltransferase
VSGVRFRPVDLDDAEAIAAIYAPYVRDTTISFEVDPPSAATMRERIAGVVARYPYLVAEQAGNVAGYAYAGPFRARAAYRWTVETTVYVDRALGRLGIGRTLCQALLDRLTALGFVSAIGIIALPNEGSVGLHEALGFAPVGTEKGVGYKFGAWHDVGVWQRDLAPRSDQPPEPGRPG